MTHSLDAVARRIFTVALETDECGAVLECLFDGGSVTIDAGTGRLVYVAGMDLSGMIGSDAD